jgi:hypothetical protein
MSSLEYTPTLRYTPCSPFKVPPDMNYNIQRYLLAPPETDHFTLWTSCSRGTFPPSGCPWHDFVTFDTREDFAFFLERGMESSALLSTRLHSKVDGSLGPENNARITLQPSLGSDINCASGPGAEYGCEPTAGKLGGWSDSQTCLNSRAARKRSRCYTDNVMADMEKRRLGGSKL